MGTSEGGAHTTFEERWQKVRDEWPKELVDGGGLKPGRGTFGEMGAVCVLQHIGKVLCEGDFAMSSEDDLADLAVRELNSGAEMDDFIQLLEANDSRYSSNQVRSRGLKQRFINLGRRMGVFA